MNSTEPSPEGGTNLETYDIFKHSQIKEKGYISPAILAYGARGSGKSHYVKWLLYQLNLRKHFKEAYLFSQTAHLQDTYDFIPDDNKFIGFDAVALGEIINTQNSDVAQKRISKQEDSINNIFILLDDVISDNNIRKSKLLMDLFTTGRHLRISVCLLSQNFSGLNGIPPVIRNNADIVISFMPTNQYDRELMADRYLSIVSKKAGEELLKKVTNQRFKTMVIAVRMMAQARSYNDYVYQSIAPKNVPKFMIGGNHKKPVLPKTVTKLSSLPAARLDLPTLRVQLGNNTSDQFADIHLSNSSPFWLHDDQT